MNINNLNKSKIEFSDIQTNSFKLSILKYKDKVVDVQTIPSYSPYIVLFKINKSLLSPEHALDLIGNYNWKIIGNNLSQFHKIGIKSCSPNAPLFYLIF